MLANKTRYALKALIYLAQASPDEPQSANDIATATNVSRKFLESILVSLKVIGVVVSTRGHRGGYTLARPASQISFAEIIRSVEGPLALAPCASRTAYRRCDDCTDEDACRLRRVLINARNKLADLLEGTTLADAIEGEEKAESYFSLA